MGVEPLPAIYDSVNFRHDSLAALCTCGFQSKQEATRHREPLVVEPLVNHFPRKHSLSNNGNSEGVMRRTNLKRYRNQGRLSSTLGEMNGDLRVDVRTYTYSDSSREGRNQRIHSLMGYLKVFHVNRQIRYLQRSICDALERSPPVRMQSRSSGVSIIFNSSLRNLPSL